jgi:non-heme chloroperoxidase
VKRTTASADGTPIAYRVHGDGGGRSAVLLHGWMVSGAVWDELLAAWRPAGMRVLVPDLRSTGDSGAAQAGFALERYAEDVCAVLDAEHVEHAVVIGHSMGGQIAQLIAATRAPRVSGLVCVLPVPADGLLLPEELLRARVAKRIPGARLCKIDGAGHYAPNEQPKALAAVLEAFIAGLGADAAR